MGRTNAILDKYFAGLKQELEPDGINLRIEDRGRYYHRPEVIATLRMLQLLLRYPNDTLLPLILNGPYLPGIDASEFQASWLTYSQAREGYPITDWFEQNFPQKAKLLSEVRSMSRVDTVPQTITRLYRDFQIREYFEAIGDNQAVANLDKLREMARKLFSDQQALTLSQFVSMLQVKVETNADEDDAELPLDENASLERPPYIRLMTIHGAKGREFPFVLVPEIHTQLDWPKPNFLISSTDGLDIRLPTFQSQLITESQRFNQALAVEAQGRLEEEMRIFYVALTRAQHAVYLFGEASNPKRISWSKFLNDVWNRLPEGLVYRKI